MYNSGVFKMLTELCNHHQFFSLYIFITQKWNLWLLEAIHNPSSATTTLYFVYGFAYSGYFINM